MRILRLTFLLCLAACTGTPELPPDDFVRAAKSWEGYDALQMIYVWGPPDKLEEDSATWRLGNRSMRCVDKRRQETAYGHLVAYTRRECSYTSAGRYKCRVTASFDPTGFIVDVTAFSHRCGLVFADYIRLLDSEYPFNLYKYSEPQG